MRMSGRGVENVFLRLRWPDTDARSVCPSCGCMIYYACPRSASQPRWRCKACRRDFSITSGAPLLFFLSHPPLPVTITQRAELDRLVVLLINNRCESWNFLNSSNSLPFGMADSSLIHRANVMPSRASVE
jgi:hypothetical protein